MATGSWVSGLSVGSQATDILGFFDGYNTAQEASHGDDDGTDFTRDTVGTSIIVDMVLHLVEAYGSLFVVTTIMVYSTTQLFLWL